MFNNHFIWGAGTSAYQVEGAAHEDGKGISVWDEYSQIPGKILEGHRGDTACDHYHRYKEDVAMMAEMGLRAYRFSVSWTRILPNGTGRTEPGGIAFYRNLIMELLKHNIEPYLTLYWWDYPAALMRKGGWLNPSSPEWFEEYTRVAVSAFGDLVKNYMTMNETQMLMGNTFVVPKLAPGVKMADGDVIRMTHHMLLGHGRAVRAIRELVPDARTGVVLASDPAIPDKPDARNIEGAREFYFRPGRNIAELSFGLSWYADPMMLGTYPDEGLSLFGRYLPDTWEKDMETIHQVLDFQGHNIYCGQPVMQDEQGITVMKPREPGHPMTAMGWGIDPEAMYWGPRFLYERYKTPVIITENGLALPDRVCLDGKVHDPLRIDFHYRYLLELERAVKEGIPVLGYFAWSLMDNFEWCSGYSKRFGFVYVDYQTLKRVKKDSFYWYKGVMESNGASLHGRP